MNPGVGRAAGTLLFPALSVVALLLGGCTRGPSPRLSFNETVQPILSEYCYGCHGPSSSSRKAGLRLDHPEFAYAPHEKFGPAIIPGKPDSSPLVKRIEAKDPEQRMPPPEARKT
ncbi:MAG TPA: c-type cytochrome domain-containing protein, partial [Steroidobacteraceae bacterium]|nr:c-type cytochrome domain-containing protein [Steroidobacteraceae bacterium]